METQKMSQNHYKDLKYEYKDLEPFLSEEVIQTHFENHYFNESEEKYHSITSFSSINLHSLYFENLCSAFKSTGIPDSNSMIYLEIINAFGNFHSFLNEFIVIGSSIEGSGWCILSLTFDCLTDSYSLSIDSVENNNILVSTIPLLVCDLWEHAYYLQFKNDKVSYIKNYLKIIDWNVVNKRFLDGIEVSCSKKHNNVRY